MFMVTLGLLDRKTPAPQPGDVFKGFSTFLPAFLFVLIVGGAMMVLSLLIPFIGYILGMLAFPLVMFSLPMLADGKTDKIGELFRRSFEITKANYGPLLGLHLVAGIIAGVGAIACGIGVIVTMPMYPCIIAIAYRAYVPAGSGTAVPPPTIPA